MLVRQCRLFTSRKTGRGVSWGALITLNYGGRNNGRAFIRSSDAGLTFTDMTWDATTNPTPPGSCCQGNPIAPNGMHPDSHAIAEIPGTDSAIFGSDGGLVRSSGALRTSHRSVPTVA